MSEVLQSGPVIEEIKLEPVHSQGELVTGEWWTPVQPKRMSLLRRHWLFISLVALPVALAAIYFLLIASDQFVSEARFIVRTSANSDGGNLAALLQNQKLSRAIDETYAVSDYIVSRDAVDLLVRDHKLLEILSRPQADMFNRFPNFYSRNNKEYLYRTFRRFVTTTIDAESGISTIEVKAFTPDDAHDLAVALLQSGESLINRLNARAHNDALTYANQVVDEAKRRVVEVAANLTKFRNDRKVIDPNKEAAAALDVLARMNTELAQLEIASSQQIANAPHSPTLQPTREKIISLKKEIDKQRAQIVGNNESMVTKLAEFDKLTLDRQLASKSLEAALSQLNSAQQEAQQQQLYLQTIVEPNLADQPLYPKRMLNLMFVIGICLCFFWSAKAIIGNVMEHQA